MLTTHKRNSLPGCYYRDSDFCFLDDMTGMSIFPRTSRQHVSYFPIEGEYVDLVVNPERFTGYIGEAAHRVWRAIYQENCFGLSELPWTSQQSRNPVIIPHTFAKPRLELDPFCLEKRVYYRIISGVCRGIICSRLVLNNTLGLHASITTHICRENFNRSTLGWVSIVCFGRNATHSVDRHLVLNALSREWLHILNACNIFILIRCCFCELSHDLVHISLYMTIARRALMKKTFTQEANCAM
jgi:ERO1-like protein beta